MSEQFDFLWNTIKERAKTLVNPISYSTFIENLVPVDVVNKKIVLQAESELAAKTITKNHMDKLREAVTSAGVDLNGVIIVVEGSEEFSLHETPDALEETGVQLDKRFTFDSYVVGTSNKFVFAAAKSVAEAPGENFNPLYIYGGTGLGKNAPHAGDRQRYHAAETFAQGHLHDERKVPQRVCGQHVRQEGFGAGQRDEVSEPLP